MRRQSVRQRAFAALFLTFLLSIPYLPQTASSAPTTSGEEMDQSYQTMSIPLSFPEAECQVDESGNYLHLELEGTTGYTLLPGAPMLPMWGGMLSFPPGSDILGVDIDGAVTDKHILPRKVFPAPEPVPNVAGAGPAPVFEGPAYSRNALYPDERLTSSITTGMGDMGQIEAHLFVKVFPIRYNPVTGQIIQIKTVTLNVRYSLPAPVPRTGNESHDILVLTPSEFESDMGRYVQQKEMLGFSAMSVNLTSIYSNTYFNTSAGRDNQERIKLFLAAAQQNWSIKYVVLVGDTDKFPTRTAYINDIDGTSTPSDLYYGDLFKSGTFTFCDWDRDRDGRYAESDSSSANQDAVDFDPDVAVGRFPAGNVAELRAMINKTIGYAANVTGTWFPNVTLVGSDTFANCAPWYDSSGIAEGEYGCDRASTYIPLFNFSKFYETRGSFNAQNIKDCLNRGEGFALFADHGNVDGVVYPSTGGVGLTSSTATSLTNGPRLPLSVLDACLTHAIDYGECLGEYLVLNPNGGSINSIGATRIGYGMFGAWHTYANSGYMMVHLMEHFGNGTMMPGPMLDATKRGYLSDVGIWDYADVKTLVEYIQLGDPVTFIGGPGLGRSLESDKLMADPGASVYFHIQLRNTALRLEYVNLSVAGGKWDHALDTGRVIIPARSSVNITLRVDVSPDADAYETDICTLVMVPMSTGLPLELNLTTGANCVRDIEFGLDRNRFFADPGENISINYSLQNKGNVAENVLLDMWGVGRDSWLSRTTIMARTIGPRSSADGTAIFAVPQKCLAGTYFFQVGASAAGLPSNDVPVEVTVNEVSGFELGALNDHVPVSFRARFDISVENIGNHFDRCGLSVDQIPLGWSVSCPSKVGLEAYSNTTVPLIAMPGMLTVAGDYVVGVSFFSEKGVLLQTLNLTATVGPSSSLDLVCPDNLQVVERGSDASFGLVFLSHSNFEETVSFASPGLPAGWGWSVAPDPVKVAPFGRMEAALAIRVPSDTPAGYHTLSFEARTPSWKRPLDLTVEVLEQRSFSAYLDRDKERLLPGADCSFGLSIRNTGNCPDRYILSAEGHLSILFSENMLQLDPGSMVALDIGIGVPQMTRSGDYFMTITISSLRDPLVKKTMTVEIKVERISLLSLTYEPGSQASRGEKSGFWLDVRNLGPETETVRMDSLCLSWDAGCAAITVPPCASRRVLIGYTVPYGLEGGGYDISLVVSSEMQSWNITHRVNVPVAPPVQGDTINVSNTSQYTLGLALAAVMIVASVAVFLAIWINGKRRKGKASPTTL